MYDYVARRLIATIPVMAIVAFVVFALVHLSPTDPAAVIAGDYASPAHVEEIRRSLGLDQPFVLRFGLWLATIARGDLGMSIFTDKPVADLILQRLEPTALLALCTITIAVLIAVPLGTIAAWQAGTAIDRGIMLVAVLGISVPAFWIGYLLIAGVSLKLGWLPVQGFRSPSDGMVAFLRHIALPSLTLGVAYAALIARVTRASLVEVLHQDYIRMARAKGLSMPAVLVRHALPNAAVPIVTVIGIGVAYLIGGVVVTESVFAIPGVGRLTVDSIQRKDVPVIQGVLLVFSGVYVVINLIVDLLYTVLDPRIRYEG
ncbi:MAG: ABC transporter permease [Thalassobaculales bacterium]